LPTKKKNKNPRIKLEKHKDCIFSCFAVYYVRYSYIEEVFMIKTEVTSLSSKGQVVIPDQIRKQMGLTTGSKLIVITDGSNLLLKPLEEPKIDVFKKLIEESRKFAKKENLKKSEVEKAIKGARRASRS
jgi:AbrB family looped-hinge helix DNA binding protein